MGITGKVLLLQKLLFSDQELPANLHIQCILDL